MGEPLSQSCFLITKHCRILIRVHPLHRCFLPAEIITIQHTLDTNKPIFQRKYLTKQCFDSLWSPWHPVKNGRSLSNNPEGHPGTISSTRGIPLRSHEFMLRLAGWWIAWIARNARKCMKGWPICLKEASLTIVETVQQATYNRHEGSTSSLPSEPIETISQNQQTNFINQTIFRLL